MKSPADELKWQPWSSPIDDRFAQCEAIGLPDPRERAGGATDTRAARHNLRPAHIHFMIHKAGYKTQFSQLYSADDPHLETDVAFGVTAALIGHYEAHEDNVPVPDADVKGRWYSLQHRFVVMRGEAVLPAAPITGKLKGERAEMVVWRGGITERQTMSKHDRSSRWGAKTVFTSPQLTSAVSGTLHKR
jgi:hypothetical protein